MQQNISKALKKQEKYGIIVEVNKKGGLKIMEINKKMYKYTAIISMTIVLILIFTLIKPILTIADTTYGISSINYDKNEAVMSVACTRLDEHVNSFLYWVSTEEEIPTKENLDELAEWCVKNAIKVVPLKTTSINDSIKITKTGKYYAVMLLKKANEEGTEEYVKAFVATYVVNTPIKEKDLNEEEVEEELAGNDNDTEEQPTQEPEKEAEEQPAQEPEKEAEEQPAQEPEKETEEQPAQEPEKETEEQPAQEPVSEPEEQSTQEPEKDLEEQLTQENEQKNTTEDKPLYVRVDNKNENESKNDEYVDIPDEIKDENNGNKISEQELDKTKEDSEQVTDINNEDKNDEKIEVKNEEKETVEEIKNDESVVLDEIQIDSQAQEEIPQTGSNEGPLVIGIVLFSIIGIGSFVKYLKVK